MHITELPSSVSSDISTQASFSAETRTHEFSLKDARNQLQQVLGVWRHQLQQPTSSDGPNQLAHLNVLEQRTDKQLPRLLENLSALYGHREDFADVFQDVLSTFIETGLDRPEEMRALDTKREQQPEWYGSHQAIETSLYVDKQCGSVANLAKDINLFKALNVSIVHLMPTVYKLPSGDHDGGYAISDFRSVNPELGTMDELRDVFSAMRKQGISPAMDVTVNHTAHDHAWAQAAKAGDPEKRDFYFFMDRAEKDEYQPHLFDIFPDIRKGCFTWNEETNKYVWTTFKSTQWDLNYKNPKVLNAMAKELMFLANQGAEILRFDAAAFIWKEKGTSCFNQENVIPIIHIYNAMAKIAAPALAFKSESIQEPKFAKPYTGQTLCQLGYNAMIPSHLWDSLANQNVEFFSAALAKHMQEPDGRTWVNYTRSHDELAFHFDMDLLGDHQIDLMPRLSNLGQFYMGKDPKSFSRGEKFQVDPRKFSGTQASLAGLEKALKAEDPKQVQAATDRIKLLNSIVTSIPGIPLINMIGGDERGLTNDNSYVNDPNKENDSRWLHRPDRPDDLTKISPLEVQSMDRVFSDLAHLTRLRSQEIPAFGNGEMRVFSSGNPAVLSFLRKKPEQTVMVLANFSEHPQQLDAQYLNQHGLSKVIDKIDPVAEPQLDLNQGLTLKPYQPMWLVTAPVMH